MASEKGKSITLFARTIASEKSTEKLEMIQPDSEEEIGELENSKGNESAVKEGSLNETARDIPRNNDNGDNIRLTEKGSVLENVDSPEDPPDMPGLDTKGKEGSQESSHQAEKESRMEGVVLSSDIWNEDECCKVIMCSDGIQRKGIYVVVNALLNSKSSALCSRLYLLRKIVCVARFQRLCSLFQFMSIFRYHSQDTVGVQHGNTSAFQKLAQD